MGGYRVLLDLSDYFSDYRWKSWIYIDPNKFRNIQNIKDHISKVFLIEDDFGIFLCGSFVPNTECINIIVEGDVLEIKRSDSPHNNTVILREASICMENNGEKTRQDEEIVSEEKKRKKSKKRKIVNDTERYVKESSSEVMETPSLPKDFHPAFISTMTPQKKSKSSHHSAELGASMENSILEGKMDLSKMKPIKKGKRAKETIEMVEDAEAASCGNEEESVNSLSCVDINEKSNSSRDKENASTNIKLSKTGLRDLTVKSDTVDVSNISEIVGDSDSDALLSQHSLSGQSLPHIADCVSDTSKGAPVPKKRKRTRSRRKKCKIGLTNLSASSSQGKPLQSILPHSASPSEKSAVRWHLRFSDLDEERDSTISTHEIAEESKETAVNEMSENRSISVDSQVKNLTENVEKETVMKPDEEHVKEMEVECKVKVASVKDVRNIEVIDQQESDEDDTGAIKNVEEKDNGENNNGEIELHAKEEASEVPSINKYVRRIRKTVLSTGLGETLAHLMKDVKTPDKDDSLIKPCPPKSVKLDDVLPKPIVTNRPVQRNKKDKRYKGFPILEKYPKKGDILAFKILKLNQHYEPCISGYIEGTVAVCDKDQSWVKVKILEGSSELERRNGKLDLQLEEDDKDINKIDDVILDLQWKDIIEPRLVFP